MEGICTAVDREVCGRGPAAPGRRA